MATAPPIRSRRCTPGAARRTLPAAEQCQPCHELDSFSAPRWMKPRRPAEPVRSTAPDNPCLDAKVRKVHGEPQRGRHVLHFPLADAGTTSSLRRVRASVCSLIPPTWDDFLAVTP